MQDAIPELDRQGLRQFGIVTGGILAGLFGLFFPWLFGLFFPWLLEHSYPYWPWIVGGVLAVWALVVPQTLRGFYRKWMQFALVLSRSNSA